MKTIRKNGNYAMITNKRTQFTVYMGYTAGGEDTCIKMKTYKTENAAIKAADKFLN